MTTIGYATLQIIPSLRGVSEAINKQLGGMPNLGKDAGKLLGGNIATGVRGSEAQISAALAQAVNRRGGEKAGQEWADGMASSMAKHLQSAQTSQKLTSSLAFLQKNGDEAGRDFAEKMATRLGIDLPAKTKAQRIGEKIGQVIAAPLGLAIRGGLLGAAGGAAAGVAGIGYVLTKGFERLKSIDDAKFKLQALGHSASEVQAIMDSALASVKGTSFGLDDAANTAASAVAAGVEPGQKLTKYLTDIADASAVAGTDFSEMASVFNNVTTLNAAYNDSLQILAQKGLPVYTWLSEAMHVSTAEVKKLASEGKISAATFQQAVETHIGGAAKTMGGSLSGSIANAEAALSRLGAAFLKPVFGNFAGGVGSITDSLDKMTAWVDAHQAEIIGFFERIGSAAITGAEHVAHGVGGMLQAIGDIAGGIGNIQGTVLKFESWQATVRGDTETAAELHRQSEAAYGWGESIRALGDKLVNANFDGARQKVNAWGDAARNAAQDAHNAGDKVTGLGTALGALPLKKVVTVDADTGPAEVKMQSWFDKWRSIIAAPPTPTPAPPIIPSLTDPNRPPLGGGRAFGGPISGAGGPKSDIIPIWASNGEHMLSASDVQAMGGQAGVYRFRSMLRSGMFGKFAGGGGMDFWKLGGTGGDSDVKGHGVGDIGKRIDSPLKPRHPIWGDERRGIIQGPGWSPRGNQDDVGVIAPWWMFPGDKPSKQRGGIFGMDPRSPGWDRRRDIFGQVPGRYNPPVKTPFQTPGPSPGAQWWGPSPERLLGFAGGGAVGPDVSAAEKLVGHPYSQGSRFDCSGDVARVINAALGMGGGLMSTKTAKEWLAARGFVPGTGGPGQITVGWYDHGPGPNDGHMAMTLSDGRPAEGGGSVGVFTVGAGASGAGNPQFDQHMFLPTVYGEGPAGSSSTSPFAGGSAAAAVTGAGTAPPPNVSGGGTTSPSGGGGSGFSVPSSISGLASFGLDNLGSGVGTTGSGSDLSLFGKAAGAAVSGQVDSALGVLGVSGSPGWLKAISTLVGGIKVGGGGGSAAPLAAGPSGTGTPAPDDPGNMHGTNAGQAPGPQTVYNIRTATVEDAFLQAQRKQNERNAAKLSRF